MAAESETDNGDYLGYGVYADTLWNRIQAALDKDLGGTKTLGDDPLVVGIFGEWGAGKSRLLKMVEKRAIDQLAKEKSQKGSANAAAPTLTVPVYFQPWKYEHEKHLLVPMVMHVLEATRSALKRPPGPIEKTRSIATQADQAAQKSGAVVHQAAKTARKWYPVLRKIASSLSLFGVSIELPPEIGDWLKDVEDVSASPEARAKKEATNAQAAQEKKIAWDDTGFHYYRLQELLTSLTRPKDDKGQPLARINFAIFIDDLDRCLPEKAVETLELIKTVFNLESFAFVLALDEEVVERGIGHRYKDYALVNKKPEMPITGFEYLEKIVHLPFRLPALTAGQAANLLRHHEKALEKQAEQRWFDAPPVNAERPVGKDEQDLPRLMRGAERGAALDLWPLLSSAFDQFVPRKLIRVAELMQQLGEVNRKPGRKPIARRYGQSNALDPRVVLALVLLQLFAPDIYRFMRRRPEAFSTLLGAFVEGAARPLPFYVADADLMDWVVPERAARTQRRSPPSPLHTLDALHMAAAERWRADPRERAAAQNLRFPLVRLLLEHRSLARHVFDPIKLFQTLAADLAHTGQNARAIALRPYLRLLVEAPPRHQGGEKKQRHRLHHVNELAEDMLFDDDSVRANLLDRHDVPEDAWLARGTVEQLAAALASKLNADADRSVAGAYAIDALSRPEDLQDAIAPADRPLLQAVLKLAAQDHDWDPPEALQLEPKTKAKPFAQYADLRSAWDWDERFDKKRWQLPRERWPGHGDEAAQKRAEPVVGFVRLQATDFSLGVDGESDNPPKTINTSGKDKDFFMARYLTTVAQFQAFVDGKGYETDDWWDSQGWAWKSGQWASATNDPDLRRWLDDRTLEQRQLPMDWAAQLRTPSRPVWGVNWFEARAYARWLSAQLQPELAALGAGYAVRLPTEWQWERAARAGQGGVATTEQAPWGDDDQDAHRWANIGAAAVGQASVVGTFPPSAMGLSDLHGNLWEWQDNLYTGEPLHEGCERLPKIVQPMQTDAQGTAQAGPDWLKTEEEWSESDTPALRGGAWGDTADFARASIRDRFLPDGWDDSVGFRVVLSLAQMTSDT